MADIINQNTVKMSCENFSWIIIYILFKPSCAVLWFQIVERYTGAYTYLACNRTLNVINSVDTIVVREPESASNPELQSCYCLMYPKYGAWDNDSKIHLNKIMLDDSTNNGDFRVTFTIADFAASEYNSLLFQYTFMETGEHLITIVKDNAEEQLLINPQRLLYFDLSQADVGLLCDINQFIDPASLRDHTTSVTPTASPTTVRTKEPTEHTIVYSTRHVHQSTSMSSPTKTPRPVQSRRSNSRNLSKGSIAAAIIVPILVIILVAVLIWISLKKHDRIPFWRQRHETNQVVDNNAFDSCDSNTTCSAVQDIKMEKENRVDNNIQEQLDCNKNNNIKCKPIDLLHNGQNGFNIGLTFI